MSAAQSLRDQRVARTIDRDVAPIWHDRFARLIWRNLPAEAPGLTLDVHSGSGRTTAELLHRLDPNTRIIALEPDEAMRTLAKARIGPEFKERVYLKAGDMTDVADMGDATYDLVVANLVLSEAHDMAAALRGLIRITKPGGELLATLPMDGTWAEAEDLLREVMRDADLQDAVRRLRRLANLRPTGHEIARTIGELGIGPDHFIIEQERFSLLFRSGREFLFTPLIEHGPLRLWKAILAGSGNPQELFWRLKEAVDAYFTGHVFSVTVVAGLLRLRVPPSGMAGAHAAAETAGEYWRRYPELDALWQAAERGAANEATPAGQPEEEEVEIDIDIDEPAAPERTEGRTDTPMVATPPPGGTQPHPVVHAPPPATTAAEDDAIFKALEQPQTTGDADEELHALLDQVLEFAGPPGETRDEIEELDDDVLEEIDAESSKRPGDTLKRIRALIPPHPDAVPKPPPLPGQRRRRDDSE